MDEKRDEAAETDLGHPGLDDDHREQLELIIFLQEAIGAGKTCPEVAGDLVRLVLFLEEHFRAEQDVMIEHAYPDYEFHKLEHDRAIALLREMEARCRAGDAQMTADNVAALRGWLLSHIQTTDRKLAEFMTARDLELH